MICNNDGTARGHRMTNADSDLNAIFNKTLRSKPMLGSDNLCAMTKLIRTFSDDSFIPGNSYLIRIRDDHIREYVRASMWFEAKNSGSIDSGEPGLLSALDEALGLNGLHVIFRSFSESNTKAIFAAYVDDKEFFPIIPSTILDACDKANETQTQPPIEIWDLHIDLSKI